DAERTSTLERLLARADPQLVVPAAPPPGVERALVLWSEGGRRRNDRQPPSQIIYLGPGKQLSLSWRARPPGGAPDEQLTAGEWAVSLQVRRAQFYHLWGVSTAPPGNVPGPSTDAPAFSIAARGFTRAELLAVVAGLGPLDLPRWRAQRDLFEHSAVEPQARAALEAAIDTAQPPAAGALIYRRERFFSRANTQPETLRDPYHLARYSRNPPAYRSETWLEGLSAAGHTRRYSEMYDAREDLVQSWLIVSGKDSWSFNAASRQLSLYPNDFEDQLAWIDPGTRAAIDLLANPGHGVTMREGTRYVARLQPIERSEYEQLSIAAMDDEALPFIADLNVSLVVTELGFAAGGGVSSTRTSVVGHSDGRRIESLTQLWNLEEQRPVERDEAPLSLRDGGTPNVPARYVADWVSADQLYDPLISVPISRAQELLRTPLFVLPADGAFKPLPIELWSSAGSQRTRFTNEPLLDAAREGRGVWTHYRTEVGLQLSLFQGPAEPLADYLRTHPNAPFWQQSVLRRARIAGQDTQGWLMSNGKQLDVATLWYFVEVDGTLIVAQGSGAWFPGEGVRLLGQLQKVTS
ncbi:MAG: hypothetical protein H7Y32_04270, partial [Chloroflexales bacterium]|nr:hypothetical protein [Chloroflexales bacterium]